jgi:hypothetical protein
LPSEYALSLNIFSWCRIGARNELRSTAWWAKSCIWWVMTNWTVDCSGFLSLGRAHKLFLLLFYLDDLVWLCFMLIVWFFRNLLTVKLNKISLWWAFLKGLGVVWSMHTRLIKHNIEWLLNVLLKTQIFKTIFVLFRNRVVTLKILRRWRLGWFRYDWTFVYSLGWYLTTHARIVGYGNHLLIWRCLIDRSFWLLTGSQNVWFTRFWFTEKGLRLIKDDLL